jgi:hypothetical protein
MLHDHAWIFCEPAPADTLGPMARTAEVVRALKAAARTLTATFAANLIGINPSIKAAAGGSIGPLAIATILAQADWLNPLLGFQP